MQSSVCVYVTHCVYGGIICKMGVFEDTSCCDECMESLFGVEMHSLCVPNDVVGAARGVDVH